MAFKHASALILAFVGALLSSALSAADLVNVRVGIVNASSDVGFFIADKKGYFREEGISVSFTEFDSGARMVAPLGTGQLDVGAGSVSLDHAFALHLSGTGWALGELAAGILGAIAAVLVGRRETAAPVAAAPASATPAERFARTETPADRPRTPAADPRFRAPGGDERAADEEFDRLPRS